MPGPGMHWGFDFGVDPALSQGVVAVPREDPVAGEAAMDRLDQVVGGLVGRDRAPDWSGLRDEMSTRYLVGGRQSGRMKRLAVEFDFDLSSSDDTLLELITGTEENVSRGIWTKVLGSEEGREAVPDAVRGYWSHLGLFLRPGTRIQWDMATGRSWAETDAPDLAEGRYGRLTITRTWHGQELTFSDGTGMIGTLRLTLQSSEASPRSLELRLEGKPVGAERRGRWRTAFVTKYTSVEQAYTRLNTFLGELDQFSPRLMDWLDEEEE